MRGVLNGTAPNPVTNAEFHQIAGRGAAPSRHFSRCPALALKAIFGEMADMLITGQRVLPKAAQAGGFRFQYPELGPALANLLK